MVLEGTIIERLQRKEKNIVMYSDAFPQIYYVQIPDPISDDRQLPSLKDVLDWN